MLPASEHRVVPGNILVATDFSSASAPAVAYALSLARRLGSNLYFAHVVRPDTLHRGDPCEPGSSLDQAWREGHHLTTDLLIAGHLRGITHKLLIAQGEIWDQLAAMVRENDIGLIVVGTHRRTGLKKMLLGSVAETIFRQAPCPVLTVGPDFDAGTIRDSGPRRILYATDLAPAATAASYAFLFARQYDAHLILLHVIQESGGTGDSRLHKSQRLESAKARLGKLVTEHGGLARDPELIVGFGTPVTRVLDVASEKKPDLIVLGVQQASGRPERHVWATASAIVRQSACPVLTVREPETTS